MTNRHVGIRRYVIVTGVAVAALAILPDAAWACESCWGAKIDTPTTRGITMAMTALLGMTGLVWGGIGAFFLHVRRRSRLLEPGKLIVTESGHIRDTDDEIDGDKLY